MPTPCPRRGVSIILYKIQNKINIRQSELIKKVREIRSSKKELLFPKLTLIFNFIRKLLVKISHTDKIDPKILAFLIMLLRIVFKGSLYINIAVAVLVFLSHALDIEFKLTWELFTYLIPALVIAFKTYLADFWGRFTSFLKYILEKFTANLKEVKDTVEHDVERVVHSIDTTGSDPKPKDNIKSIKNECTRIDFNFDFNFIKTNEDFMNKLEEILEGNDMSLDEYSYNNIIVTVEFPYINWITLIVPFKNPLNF
jgi:hypothetical protein